MGHSSHKMGRMSHTPDEAAALAAYLAKYIEDNRWSEREAAARLGFKRSTLQRRLARADFKMRELPCIAANLGITKAELTERLEQVSA